MVNFSFAVTWLLMSLSGMSLRLARDEKSMYYLLNLYILSLLDLDGQPSLR